MNIPNRQFELKQQPPTGLFILSFFGTFFLCAAICLPLAFLAGDGAMLIFPFAPPLLTALAVQWLQAPCTVALDAAGFSVEVKRGSIGVPLGTKHWTWNELVSFDYFVNRGTFLVLEMKGESIVFSRGELRKLRDVLHEYFPDKKKRGWS